MRYTVIVQKSDDSYAAWVPDLPGCVTNGPTVTETLANMRAVIEFHLEGIREQGEPIPVPNAVAAVIDVRTEPESD